MIKKIVTLIVILGLFGQSIAFAAPAPKKKLTLRQVQAQVKKDLSTLQTKYGATAKDVVPAVMAGMPFVFMKRSELEALQLQLEEAQKKLAQTETKLAEAKTAGLTDAAKIASLEEQLADAKAGNPVGLVKKITRLEDLLANARVARKTDEAYIAQLRKQLYDSQKQLQEMKTLLDTRAGRFEFQINQLEQQLANSSEEQVAVLEKKLAKTTKALEKLTADGAKFPYYLEESVAIWREEAEINRAIIQSLRKQIARLQGVPLSQVVGEASYAEMAALAESLSGTAFFDIAVSSNLNTVVRYDPTAKALVDALEAGDEEAFSKITASFLKNNQASVQEKRELQSVFTSLQKRFKAAKGKIPWKEVLSDLTPYISSRAPTNYWNIYLLRSIGKQVLKRAGVLSVMLAVVAIPTLAAGTNQKEMAMARRIIASPEIFANASDKDFADIESSQLASQVAREVADVLHEAVHLNQEDMDFAMQNYRTQMGAQQQKGKIAVQDMMHSIRTVRAR